VEDDRRWVFNRLADDYAVRPGYPEALVARLLGLAGGPGARVAELGAGTGLLALALARAGARVHAVEPARAMLQALRAAAGLPAGGAGAAEGGAPAEGEAAAPGAALPVGAGAVTPVHASGEATGLPGGAFALVVLADALHWVDAARAGAEASRLLAPGGAVAVVEPRPAATPFMDALAALLAGANPKARPQPPPVGLFFAHAAGAPPGRERFLHEEVLPPARLDAVLRSLSLVGPALGPAARQELLARAGALAEAHGGAAWRRELLLHWARRG
jgi:SAM-dependent methyltransferase